MARALRGIEMGALAQIVDDALERLDLRGQLAGGDTIAAVLDFQHRVGGSQLIDFTPRAPTRAEAYQYRQHQDERDRAGERTQADSAAAYHATGTVGDDNRVTACSHRAPSLLVSQKSKV
jgi:hypothetical protein